MQGGVPTDMPVGIVDQDNSHTSRQLVHKLDAFQTTKVVAHYENIAEARHAIQKNEIYAFLVIPNGTEAGLMASRQPKISFYYSSVSLAAGSPALPRPRPFPPWEEQQQVWRSCRHWERRTMKS